MSVIQDTPPTVNPFAPYSAQNAAKSAADDIQDRFLKLLVTQMKNQDPLNPLDNAQVTTQLAQISTVNGIEKLNATISAMASGITAGQSLQAAGMIGKDVLVPGSALRFSGGSGIFGVDLTQAVDKVKITISDSAGHVVQIMDLDGRTAGPLTLTWDGKTRDGSSAADGEYNISVEAVRADQKIEAQTLSRGTVEGVWQGKEGVGLNVGTLGTVGLADVRQIY
jgi:flagellar basal-body rod modification protein FlgD